MTNQFNVNIADVPRDTLCGLYLSMLKIRKVQLKIEEESQR